MDDQVLVRRARRGDDAAFEVLVRRHADTVWRFARSMVRDDDTAEEIVQDTFFKAYRGLATYRGDAAVTTWLYTICRRTMLDRSRRPQPTLVELETREELANTGHESSLDDRIALTSAIDALPEPDREAFVLSVVLGYSQEEAAGLVGVPPSTMRSRVARARTRLVIALSSEEEEDAK